MARYRLDDEVICQATSMPGDASSINPDKAPIWVDTVEKGLALIGAQ
jgi:hypothetical protein